MADTISIDSLSESDIHKISLQLKGTKKKIDIDLDLNISWDDFKVLSKQAVESQKAGKTIDPTDEGLNILVGTIKDWNLMDKGGKKAVIDVVNIKKLGPFRIGALVKYIQDNSDFNTDIKKKN